MARHYWSFRNTLSKATKPASPIWPGPTTPNSSFPLPMTPPSSPGTSGRGKGRVLLSGIKLRFCVAYDGKANILARQEVSIRPSNFGISKREGVLKLLLNTRIQFLRFTLIRKDLCWFQVVSTGISSFGTFIITWSCGLSMKKTPKKNTIGFVKFSPNGKFILASTWDNNIRLWSCQDNRVLKTYVGHRNESYCILELFLWPAASGSFWVLRIKAFTFGICKLVKLSRNSQGIRMSFWRSLAIPTRILSLQVPLAKINQLKFGFQIRNNN